MSITPMNTPITAKQYPNKYCVQVHMATFPWGEYPVREEGPLCGKIGGASASFSPSLV